MDRAGAGFAEQGGRGRTVVVSWSTGKDAAYALHRLRKVGRHTVVGLLTTVTEGFDRVSMHGVRTTLMEAQARATGLPLYRVPIPYPCPNTVYERRMRRMCRELREQGVSAVAFGDLFLEEVRAYRESRLEGTGLEPIFPLWGRETRGLAREMIASGLRATLVCVDPKRIPARLAGREFDASLLEELPAGTDPCGENGEFHTFVHAGPMLARPVPVAPGAVVARDGFVFADLVPGARRVAPGVGGLPTRDEPRRRGSRRSP